MNHTQEVYPNSPLVEVVFEIRFSPNLAIENLRHQFQEQIAKEYPVLLLPRINHGECISTIPYKFESEDENKGIMLAIDRFALYTRRYDGFQRFNEEFQKVKTIFMKNFRINNLLRIGWRYINVIPFNRKDGAIPYNNFLNISLNLPKDLSNGFQSFNTVFLTKKESGNITTKIESVRNKEQEEAILLDIDYSETQTLDMGKIERYIKISHGHSRAVFEEIITDSYREFLRGERLEC